MPKSNSTPVNYYALLLSSVKEKSLSFTVGFLIFLLVSIVFFQQLITNLKLLTTSIKSQEKIQIKKPVQKAKTELRIYTVLPGDELFLIAEKIYGSGLNMEDIMKTNKITDPNLLEVGQKLIIPSVKPRYPTIGEVTENAAKTSQVRLNEEKYVVKDGDSLVSIALQAYGDSYSWIRIANANNLTNPDNLEVGTILIVPK